MDRSFIACLYPSGWEKGQTWGRGKERACASPQAWAGKEKEQDASRQALGAGKEKEQDASRQALEKERAYMSRPVLEKEKVWASPPAWGAGEPAYEKVRRPNGAENVPYTTPGCSSNAFDPSCASCYRSGRTVSGNTPAASNVCN
jgi:hypothetical protein